MAEDERAAKAARARAMLKKRQQQKTAGGAVSPSVASAGESISRIASPSPPPSRSFTPAPAEIHSPTPFAQPPQPLQPKPQVAGRNGHVARGSRDLGDLFVQGSGNGGTDNDWLSSLTPVDPPALAQPPKPVSPLPVASRRQSLASPHAPIASPPPQPSSTKPGEREDLHALIQDQARAIAALESEKTSLTASLEQLKHAESKSQQTHNLLQEERNKVDSRQKELQRIQADFSRLSSQYKDQQNAISTLESDKAALTTTVKSLEATSTELQRTLGLLQEERENVRKVQTVMERMQLDLERSSQQAQQQQQYISSLESEKISLKSSLQDLTNTRTRAQQLERELQDELQVSQEYQEHVRELEGNLEEITSRSEQQQQTISFLVSEKTTLTSQLEQLQSAESELVDTSKLLEVERSRGERLQVSVHQLEAKTRDSSERIELLSTKERELTDKSRDQEREIALLTGTTNELRSQADKYQRRVRELEEQIESDDRAERLEATLQHTQDRAAELEFQVSKLKQAQTTLKAERDNLEGQLHTQKVSEASWQSQHAEIEKQHSSTKEELSSITSERNNILQERSTLQSQVDGLQTSLTELQQKLSQTAAEMITSVRALQQTQTELRNANRRADEAEQIQKDLRTEGLGLMRSLDEMRPKIVELTDIKLELGEKVASLEQALRARDSTISQMEASLEELRDQQVNLEKEHQQTNVILERERSSSQVNATELQKAYADLQTELQTTKSNVKHLEEERSEYRNMANRHMDEVDHLTSSLQSHSEQLASLRAEMIERNDARQEAQEFLEHAREEMEALQAELAVKDAEIERLQEAVTCPTTSTGPHSLDEEMLSALKQQHVLELSAAQSEIRHLESVVFQAEARAHSLQKQVNAMEEQLAHYRPASRGSSVPLRTTSRVGISDELRRASFGSHRSSNLAPPLSDFDGLSPETRHKRKVSLSMLKARIDSEVAGSKSKGMSPAQKPSSLPSVAEQDYESSRSSPVIINSARRAPQFLDETHVFWCHSCHGDLVIL